MRLRIVAAVVLGLSMLGCGDGTGPSNDGTGRYRLTYMSGAQPPWRYVDAGGSIGDDVDSVMLRMTHAQEFTLVFYLHVSAVEPTWLGTWMLSASNVTFQSTAGGSSPASGLLNGSNLTINEVSRLMPGMVFPNGVENGVRVQACG